MTVYLGEMVERVVWGRKEKGRCWIGVKDVARKEAPVYFKGSWIF